MDGGGVCVIMLIYSFRSKKKKGSWRYRRFLGVSSVSISWIKLENREYGQILCAELPHMFLEVVASSEGEAVSSAQCAVD